MAEDTSPTPSQVTSDRLSLTGNSQALGWKGKAIVGAGFSVGLGAEILLLICSLSAKPLSEDRNEKFIRKSI